MPEPLPAQTGNLVSTNSVPATAANTSQPSPPTIVLGFLGGFVRHDDAVHSAVQLARRLRTDFASSASLHIETFENRRRDDAHKLIVRLLGADQPQALSDQAKRTARIILYGHSWGGNAVVALARDLKADGIPVLLTIQVDSISKSGQNDAVIPDNVAQAANFFQDKGLLRGQPRIRAENPQRTQILGNFRVDYQNNNLECPDYPWFNRVFMRSHIQIECDPAVWNKIDGLIREHLPASTAQRIAVQ